MKNIIIGLFLIALLIFTDPSLARTSLTTNMNMYVNGDPVNSHTCGLHGELTCGPGSDTVSGGGQNNCQSYATPCLTNNNAAEQIFANYDQAGFTTIINMAHGASTNYDLDFSYGYLIGNINFELRGDYNNPTAVNVIAPNGGYAIVGGDGVWPDISSFEITDQGSAAGGILSGQAGVIDVSSITFAGTWNGSSALAIAQNGGRINWLGADPNTSNVPNQITGTTIGQGLQAAFEGVQNIGIPINIPNAITMQNNQPFGVGLGGQFTGMGSGAAFTGTGATSSTGRKCQMDCTYIAQDLLPNNIFPGNTNCTPYCGY